MSLGAKAKSFQGPAVPPLLPAPIFLLAHPPPRCVPPAPCAQNSLPGPPQACPLPSAGCHPNVTLRQGRPRPPHLGRPRRPALLSPPRCTAPPDKPRLSSRSPTPADRRRPCRPPLSDVPRFRKPGRARARVVASQGGLLPTAEAKCKAPGSDGLVCAVSSLEQPQAAGNTVRSCGRTSLRAS